VKVDVAEKGSSQKSSLSTLCV